MFICFCFINLPETAQLYLLLSTIQTNKMARKREKGTKKDSQYHSHVTVISLVNIKKIRYMKSYTCAPCAVVWLEHDMQALRNRLAHFE